MPGKMTQCRFCSKVMRSDNLKNHIKTVHKYAEREIPTFDGSEFDGTRPKSKETMDKLRRFIHQKDEPLKKVARQDDSKYQTRDSISKQNLTAQKSKKDGRKNEQNNSKYPVLDSILQQNLTPSIKGKDEKKIYDKDNGDNESEEESPSDSDLSEIEEKDELDDLIQSVTQYLIKYDQDELLELIEGFKEYVEEEDILEALQRLQKLTNEFLLNERREDGELILPTILDLFRWLEDSPIPRFKQLRFKILLNDIDRNRYRVKSILTRLNDLDNEERFLTVLRALAQEELISYEQYEKLKDTFDNHTELPTIANVIKDTKVGHGLKFLPRSLKDLKHKLDLTLTEVTTTGIDTMRKELMAIVDELFQRKCVTLKEYDDFKDTIK